MLVVYDYHKSMKTIPLTMGYFTKVDDDDYDKFAKKRWYAMRVKDKIRPSRVVYDGLGGGDRKSTRKYLSREIVGAKKGEWVDHINGDTLDNRKENLRICNPSENAGNRKRPRTNKSGYKGVRKANSRINPWRSQIIVEGKFIHLGNYKTRVEAAIAYDKAAKKYFGEYAKTNLKANR